MALKRVFIQKAASAAFVFSTAVVSCSIFLLQACSNMPNGASSLAPRASSQPMTVEKVDLDRYLGKWYEIARLPNRFQELCKSNVAATYSKAGNATTAAVKVENRCVGDGGEVKQVVGEARSVDVSNSKLEVRFAPAWLSWLPLVWGDYWVLHLEPDYSLALVGSPDREFLWVLSRSPTLDKTKLDMLMGKARDQGFAVEKVIATIQK
jgi:apolipoprotein D and lipocalin family protein